MAIHETPKCPRGPHDGGTRENAYYKPARGGGLYCNDGERLDGVHDMGDGTWICLDCGLNFNDDGTAIDSLSDLAEPHWRAKSGGKVKAKPHHD